MRRRVVSVLVIGGMLLPVAFAGAAAALSKDEYIVAADNICRQANLLRLEAADAVFGQLETGQEPTFDQLAEYVAGIQSTTQQEIDSLRALEPPGGDEKQLKKIFKLAQKALDKIVADPNVLLRSDPFTKANKAAKKYGFEKCGSESTD